MSENKPAASTPCNCNQTPAPAAQGQAANAQANPAGKPNKGNRKKK